MDSVENLFIKLDNCITQNDIVRMSINESLSYYELRKFVTLLYRTVKDSSTKSVIADILKALAVLEIKNKPIPTIKKLKSISPKIFG